MPSTSTTMSLGGRTVRKREPRRKRRTAATEVVVFEGRVVGRVVLKAWAMPKVSWSRSS